MKTRNIIGCCIAAIGLLLAIETKNGSDYEFVARFLGIVMLFAGAFIAKAFDFQTKEDKQ